MEKRFLNLRAEIKADGNGTDDVGRITGYGSIFNVLDSYGDVVTSGAFERTIKERGNPVMLWQHDQTQPIGVWKTAKEDDSGLLLTGEINLSVQCGREAYSLVKQGAIKGLSIGFRTIQSEHEKDGRRTISDVELYEVSLVTFPANESANITSVKSVIETPRNFERFLRDVGLSHSQAKKATAMAFKSKEEINVLRDDADDQRDAGDSYLIKLLNEIKATYQGVK